MWQLVWLSFKDPGRITAFLLNPDLHEWEWRPRIWVLMMMMMMMMDDASDKDKLTCCVCVFSKWYYKIVQCALGMTQNQRRIAQISLHFNCSVFVLSFCQSILLSRDLYLEWVWGKMTMNYKWWSWILFVCSSFCFFKHFMFSWTSSCTPHQNESYKWGVFFFWKIKWIKYEYIL